MTSLPSMPGDTGLDEAGIALVVDRFYERVRADALLGAVFNPVVEDWDAHKQLLTSFWCSVALRAGTYRGNPMAMHRSHPIRSAHFTRWLELWRETTHALLPPAAAATLCAHAGRIGTGLQLGLGLQPAGGRGLGLPLAGAATQP